MRAVERERAGSLNEEQKPVGETTLTGTDRRAG
jgi:hypothetical protein